MTNFYDIGSSSSVHISMYIGTSAHKYYSSEYTFTLASHSKTNTLHVAVCLMAKTWLLLLVTLNLYVLLACLCVLVCSSLCLSAHLGVLVPSLHVSVPSLHVSVPSLCVSVSHLCVSVACLCISVAITISWWLISGLYSSSLCFSGLSLCLSCSFACLGCSCLCLKCLSLFLCGSFLCLGYSSPCPDSCLYVLANWWLDHFSLHLGHYLGVPSAMALCLVACLCFDHYLYVMVPHLYASDAHLDFFTAHSYVPWSFIPVTHLHISVSHLCILITCFCVLVTCFMSSCSSLYISAACLWVSGVHFYLQHSQKAILDNIFLLCHLHWN